MQIIVTSRSCWETLPLIFQVFLIQVLAVRLYASLALERTFFCFSLLPLKHLLLWGQSLLQELHVKLVLLLHLLLLPETHLIAHVALEAKAQRDHWIANATQTHTHIEKNNEEESELPQHSEPCADAFIAAEKLAGLAAYQWAAKGRHKSTWKFFRSLNLMAASMYTNSIHRETVGKHTPRSGKQRRNKYYSTLSIHTHTHEHTPCRGFTWGGKTQTHSHTGCGLLRDINTRMTSYGCECHCWVTLEGSGSNWAPLPPSNWHWDFNLTRGLRAMQRGFTKSNWHLAQTAQLTCIHMQKNKNKKIWEQCHPFII